MASNAGGLRRLVHRPEKRAARRDVQNGAGEGPLGLSSAVSFRWQGRHCPLLERPSKGQREPNAETTRMHHGRQSSVVDS